MQESAIRLTVIGLGIEAVAIGVVQAGGLPAWAGWIVVVAGLAVILYGASPYSTAGVRRLILYLPISPKRSAATVDGITLQARLRWEDSTGKPTVLVDPSFTRIRWIWAILDLDIRNGGHQPERISELYLEIRHARFPKRVIAIADPTNVDRDDNWRLRPFPRRVEWLLDPVSPAETHHVWFGRLWSPNDMSAPPNPERFVSVVVAELCTPNRVIRVQIGDDIEKVNIDIEAAEQQYNAAESETRAPAPEVQSRPK
jgi:hypothetical protein